MEKKDPAPPDFEKETEEIMVRLANDDSALGQSMRAEALELQAKFRKWRTEPPERGDRVTTIKKLFDLYREAMSRAVRRP